MVTLGVRASTHEFCGETQFCHPTGLSLFDAVYFSVLPADVSLLLGAFLLFSFTSKSLHFCKKAFCFLLDSKVSLPPSFLPSVSLLPFGFQENKKYFSKSIILSELKVLMQDANIEMYEYKQDSEIIIDALIQ